MKKKDTLSLIVTGVITGVISLLIASAIFQTPASRRTQVQTASPISPTLPDVKNEPVYKSFLNDKALDPTQPIQIGGTSNNSPFSNSR
ncbi:MAG: hypothetical protein WD887_00235 [Candidatus Saccharimonadales bacterium]